MSLLAAAWLESAPQYGRERGRRLGSVRPRGTPGRHWPASITFEEERWTLNKSHTSDKRYCR